MANFTLQDGPQTPTVPVVTGDPYTDALIASKVNLAQQLAAITASPKPTYDVDGDSIPWTEYHAMLTAQIANISKLIQAADPYEILSVAVTG